MLLKQLRGLIYHAANLYWSHVRRQESPRPHMALMTVQGIPHITSPARLMTNMALHADLIGMPTLNLRVCVVQLLRVVLLPMGVQLLWGGRSLL